MALGNRRKTRLFEKSDASSKYFINSDKQTKFSSSYSEAMHLESSDFIESPENQALIYAIQQIEEDIDELRRYVTASMVIEGDITTKGLITGSQISSSGNITATGDINVSRIIASGAISSSNYITANAITSSNNVKFGGITMYFDGRNRVVFTDGSNNGFITLS